MTYARQFALRFPDDAQYGPDAFLCGEANASARTWIDHPKTWPASRLAVAGEAGVGKTHLLHVFAHRQRAALLPAQDVRLFMPLPDAVALAIDDADTVHDARALLHILNSAAERQIPVLLSGRTPPAHWRVGLADLASRLRVFSVVALRAPDDALLARLLAQFLAERQMRVPDKVQEYLLAHVPRTGAALHEAAARLDRLALASGKPITRAMAAMAINDRPSAQPEPPSEYDLLSLVRSG